MYFVYTKYVFIIKEIKSANRINWVAQAFTLLHVLRRQGDNLYFSSDMNVSAPMK